MLPRIRPSRPGRGQSIENCSPDCHSTPTVILGDRPRWYSLNNPDRSPASTEARTGRCLNNNRLDPARYRIRSCGRWSCPLHGHAVRRRLVPVVVSQLPKDLPAWTFAVHLNRRGPGRMVGSVFRSVKSIILRHHPEAAVVAFPHFAGAERDLNPYVHLHFIVFGIVTQGERETILEEVRDKNSHTEEPPARATDGGTVESLAGLLGYLARIRNRDRSMPLDELPGSGGRHRFAYGVRLSAPCAAKEPEQGVGPPQEETDGRDEQQSVSAERVAALPAAMADDSGPDRPGRNRDNVDRISSIYLDAAVPPAKVARRPRPPARVRPARVDREHARHLAPVRGHARRRLPRRRPDLICCPAIGGRGRGVRGPPGSHGLGKETL